MKVSDTLDFKLEINTSPSGKFFVFIKDKMEFGFIERGIDMFVFVIFDGKSIIYQKNRIIM